MGHLRRYGRRGAVCVQPVEPRLIVTRAGASDPGRVFNHMGRQDTVQAYLVCPLRCPSLRVGGHGSASTRWEASWQIRNRSRGPYISIEIEITERGAWGPYVKLGIVRNERQAEERNSEHQTGNPRQVVTLHQFRAPMVENLETQLHHRFAPLCVSGEWFEMDDAFLAAEVLPLVDSIIQEQANAADYFEGKAQLKNVVSSGIIRPPTDEEKAVWQAAVSAKENLT